MRSTESYSSKQMGHVPWDDVGVGVSRVFEAEAGVGADAEADAEADTAMEEGEDDRSEGRSEAIVSGETTEAHDSPSEIALETTEGHPADDVTASEEFRTKPSVGCISG